MNGLFPVKARFQILPKEIPAFSLVQTLFLWNSSNAAINRKIAEYVASTLSLKIVARSTLGNTNVTKSIINFNLKEKFKLRNLLLKVLENINALIQGLERLGVWCTHYILRHCNLLCNIKLSLNLVRYNLTWISRVKSPVPEMQFRVLLVQYSTGKSKKN